MKVERIEVDAFGTLSGFDTGADPLGGLIVVLGPNETGKSTLHTFLATALYGFHPASRERNPHVPWGAEEASGRVLLRLEDGAHASVERRLRSSPTARLLRGATVTELRNQALPWVEHVPRAVFSQVFAITLADLAGLDEEVWGRIQDRIVGAMGSSDLRSARGAADALEKEASAVWRPNRRGNQQLRDVQEELRRLRSRRAGALERDRRIRDIVEEREHVEARLGGVKKARVEQRVALDRVQTLLPVRRQLRRIAALREQGGSKDDLVGLPPSPSEALARLRAEEARLRTRLERVRAALAEPESVVECFGPEEEAILAAARDVDRFLATAREAAPARTAARETPHEIERTRTELRATAARLFRTGWSDELAAPLRAVSLDLLADRVARTGGGAEPDPPAATDGSVEAAPVERLGPPLAIATASVGFALLGWAALGGGPSWAGGGGTVLLVAALASVLLALRASHARAEPPSVRAARSDTARARAEIRSMLAGLPVQVGYMDPPSEALVAEVRRLRTLADELDELTRRRTAATTRIEEVDRAARELAARLGRNGETGAADLAPVVERDLREAERSRDAADRARHESRRIREEMDDLREELTRARLDAAELTDRLTALGPDCASGAETAEERMVAHRRADELQEELERQRPDLPELVERIRAEEAQDAAWTRDDTGVARLQAHLEELDEQIERLISESRKLERDAAHLREKETVDVVDSEIDTLREAEATLARDRDRKWVLAQIVREADRRFRETHQPDLVRRASRHLAHLTGGRYDRILIDEGCDPGPFRLFGPALPAPVPLAPPVSTGTLEQAYLSLRLAIVDHLDHERERLPLFLDEALVNWDRERRDRGLSTLADLSTRRQIFVFTCHPDVAEELAGRGARILRLDGTR